MSIYCRVRSEISNILTIYTLVCYVVTRKKIIAYIYIYFNKGCPSKSVNCKLWARKDEG